MSAINWNDPEQLKKKPGDVDSPVGQETCSELHEHVHVSRSWLSMLPHLFVFFIFGLYSVAYTSDGPASVLRFQLNITGTPYEFVFPIASLLMAVLLARPLFLMYDTSHEIRCHHVRSTSGRCSLAKKTIEIPFEDLLGVRVQQNLLERILHVGTIAVGTASTNHIEINMKGVFNPQKYASMVSKEVDRSRIAARER